MLHRRYIALSIALGGALNSPPMQAESVQVTISPLSPEHDGEDHRAAKVKAASTFSLPDQPAIDAEKVRY
jgi:hypothetical protein